MSEFGRGQLQCRRCGARPVLPREFPGRLVRPLQIASRRSSAGWIKKSLAKRYFAEKASFKRNTLCLMRIAADIARCMYYTGIDPFTTKPVHVVRGVHHRNLQPLVALQQLGNFSTV
jgi:hypothetical protein